MKKSSITGWRDVFSFTLIQTLKNKAYIISYIILIGLALISMPLVNLLVSDGAAKADGPSPIQKVYVINKTSLPEPDFTKLQEKENLRHISFEAMTENYDTVSDRIENSEKESVILTISNSNGTYALTLLKASSGPVNDASLQVLGDAAAQAFDAFRVKTLGIADQQLNMVQAPVETKVTLLDSTGEAIMKKNTSISLSEYWVIYGILFVVLMVNSMASGQIASSIVTEKSTRVIEYLLTSIKPLALMVGKILATFIAVLLQLGSMAVMLFISNTISGMISSGSKETLLSQYLPENIFQNINIVNILFCFILVLLGLIFYAVLAGLCGATVSRLEEIREGLTLFTFANIIGAYLGIGAASALLGVGDNAFVTFSYLFPLSSPFILPGAILIGKASLPIIMIAILLQIVFILLLLKFVAKVFEILILHNGNTIKVKELIKISKTA